MTDRVAFYSEGKKINGNLHLPKRKSPPCVVTLHGLDSSKDSRKWSILASNLCEAGFACLRFSFRGCGKGEARSAGAFEDTSLTGRIKDYQTALQFLEETDKVNIKRVGVIGSSFGGMVAIAAPNRKIKAMISLATPYQLLNPSKNEEGGYILPSGRRLTDKFFQDVQKYDLLKAMKEAPPILIIHGSKDLIVPVEQAYRLYKSANEPKALEIVEGANHRFSQTKNLDTVLHLSRGWFNKYLETFRS